MDKIGARGRVQRFYQALLSLARSLVEPDLECGGQGIHLMEREVFDLEFADGQGQCRPVGGNVHGADLLSSGGGR